MCKNEIYLLINNYHFNINYHANEYCTESARYTDMSDVSASAKFCVVVMERGIIRAFPSDWPMITDENSENRDGGKMTYISKGTIFFIASV